MSSSMDRPRVESRGQPGGMLSRIARRLVHHQLQSLEEGVLEIQDSTGRHRFGTSDGDIEALVRVHDPGVYNDILFKQHLGAAEAYMNGRWTSPDLTAVLRLFTRNREVFNGKWSWLSRLGTSLDRLYHWSRRNTRDGSRRNIQEHYDLGEEFYRLFLDDTMNYSCAFFEDESNSLEQAQINKMDRILNKLELSSDDHLLEIGSGWGSLACRAARRYGCRVTTTTISENQYNYVHRAIRKQSVSNRVEVLKRDYRDLKGTYDRLVSVEMIEAVGESYLPQFIEICQKRLKSGGRMAVQAIVMRDRFYEEYRKNVDFIQRYIFPGGYLPSVGLLTDLAGQKTDLLLRNLEELGQHYATTLQRWREALLSRSSVLESLGFPESFERMWEYYFSYCEAGFREDAIGNVQLVFERPG